MREPSRQFASETGSCGRGVSVLSVLFVVVRGCPWVSAVSLLADRHSSPGVTKVTRGADYQVLS